MGLLDVGRRRGIACFVGPAAPTAVGGSCLPSACCAEGCAEHYATRPGHTRASASGADVPQAAASHGPAGDCAAGALARGRWSATPRAQLAAHGPGTSPRAARAVEQAWQGARRRMQAVRALRLPRSDTLSDLPRQGEVPIPAAERLEATIRDLQRLVREQARREDAERICA